jgi:uncharacterized phage-associated protein
MASVHDVAKYVLQEKGGMDTWKLQKLVYYSQAWHTTWVKTPLFPEQIEAWANGPVCPALYQHHKHRFRVQSWDLGSVNDLTKSERKSIDVVLSHYGEMSGVTLREMTHREAPWKDARKGLPPGVSSNEVITPKAMAKYYGSL